MQIRVIRTTLSFVVFLLAMLSAGNAALADESLRIARPQTSIPASTLVSTPSTSTSTSTSSSSSFEKNCSAENITKGVPLKDYDPCCGSKACGADCTDMPQIKGLSSSLPADGLFARWRAEFVNPTMCPILLCHGSCAGSTMSCKNIKTMIDSLLDAYIPEEPPVQAVLNFRCCAGFTED